MKRLTIFTGPLDRGTGARTSRFLTNPVNIVLYYVFVDTEDVKIFDYFVTLNDGSGEDSAWDDDFRSLSDDDLDVRVLHELFHVDEYQRGDPDGDYIDDMSNPTVFDALGNPNIKLENILRFRQFVDAAKRACGEK